MGDFHEGIKGLLDTYFEVKGLLYTWERKISALSSRASDLSSYLHWWFYGGSTPKFDIDKTSFDYVVFVPDGNSQPMSEYGLRYGRIEPDNIMLIEIEVSHSIQKAVERLQKYGFWAMTKALAISPTKLILDSNGNVRPEVAIYKLRNVEMEEAIQHGFNVPYDFMGYYEEGLDNLLANHRK